MYYKVIEKDTRASAFIKNPKYRVFYPNGEWVTPKVKGTRLAAFSSLKDAEHWMRCGKSHGRNLICVECEVRNPIYNYDQGIPLVQVYSWYKEFDDAIFDTFWSMFARYAKRFGARRGISRITNEIEKRASGFYVSNCHKSAVLCDAIKCLG